MLQLMMKMIIFHQTNDVSIVDAYVMLRVCVADSRKSRSYLRVRRVREDDEGSYVCRAVNVLGQVVSNATTVVTLSGQLCRRCASNISAVSRRTSNILCCCCSCCFLVLLLLVLLLLLYFLFLPSFSSSLCLFFVFLLLAYLPD